VLEYLSPPQACCICALTQVSPALVRFGVFEADLCAVVNCTGGVKVRIQDLPFRALTVLLARPNEWLPANSSARHSGQTTSSWISTADQQVPSNACATRWATRPTNRSLLKRLNAAATAGSPPLSQMESAIAPDSSSAGGAPTKQPSSEYDPRVYLRPRLTIRKTPAPRHGMLAALAVTALVFLAVRQNARPHSVRFCPVPSPCYPWQSIRRSCTGLSGRSMDR